MPLRSFPKLYPFIFTFLYQNLQKLLHRFVDQTWRNIVPTNRSRQSNSHYLQRCVVNLQHLVLCVHPCKLHQRQKQIPCFPVLVSLREGVLAEVENCLHSCSPLSPICRMCSSPNSRTKDIQELELFVFP